MRQLALGLPEIVQINERERILNRLATEVVNPERRDDDDQHELFARHCRVAVIDGDFGHIVRD